MKEIRFLVFIVATLLAVSSCRKLEQLPPEPSIDFLDFEIFDTVDFYLGNEAKGGRLRFYFEDGDGDLGISAAVNQSDTNNLFVNLLRKTNGVLGPAGPNDPLRPSTYRIPTMDREGQNKIIKGEIEITFIYLYYSQADTIVYEFYVKDRAGNSSNIEYTSEIIVAKDSIY